MSTRARDDDGSAERTAASSASSDDADRTERDDADAVRSRRAALLAGAIASLGSLDALAQSRGAGAQPCLSVARPQPPQPPIPPCLSPVRMPPDEGFGGALGPPPAGSRDTLPAVVLAHCQRVSIYAAGGGSQSSPWRVVVHANGAYSAGDGGALGAPSHGALARRWGGFVPRYALRELFAAADRAWHSPRPQPSAPNTSYGELLVFVNGEFGSAIDGYGPLRDEPFASLVRALRVAAGLDPLLAPRSP